MRHAFIGSYPITNPFGVYDPAYANYPGSRHPGTDYGMPQGTELVAGMSGSVSIFDRDPNIKVGRGKEVVITNGDTQRKACHMSRINVAPGTWINEGTPIGLSGNTGYSSGPHLHDELIINGQYVSLEDYLKEEDDMKVTDPIFRRVWSALGLDIGPQGRQPTVAEINAAVGKDINQWLDEFMQYGPIKRQREKAALYDSTVEYLQKNTDQNAQKKLDEIKEILNT